MSSEHTFTGKVALVTGGASGIGLKTAELLLERGAQVAIAGRGKKVQEVAQKLDATGERVLPLVADLSNDTAVAAVVQAVVTKFGRLDILVNSAGQTGPGKIDELTAETWDEIHRNNGLATFLCCKHAIAVMKEQKYGKVVNVSSIAGRFRGMTSGLHYAYTKAGIIGFTRQLGPEVARYGINVNVVAPSQTMTPMLRSLITDEIEAELNKKIPIGYIARPEQQAEVILFLCSDAASYMVGAVVDVNGGQFSI